MRILQPGEDPARVHAERVETTRAVAPFEFVGEPNVGSLGVRVAHERVIGDFFEVPIANLAARHRVDRACDADYPALESRGGGSEQERFEELEQIEMSQMVDAELLLEAVFRFALGRERNSYGFDVSPISYCLRTPYYYLPALLTSTFSLSLFR